MAHPKGLLIERAQRLGLERPEFQTTQTGPEHEPSFVSDVVVGGEVLGTGQGLSKRDAERRAAEEAITQLDERAGGKANEEKSNTPSSSRKRKASKKAPAAAEQLVSPEPDALASTEADAADDEPFSGPWPMVDDVLASVITVAERRVNADLRGDAALDAIRDFSLRLYKEILADLGEVVDEDELEDD